jgi:release factor glutamine methyltransferase
VSRATPAPQREDLPTPDRTTAADAAAATLLPSGMTLGAAVSRITATFRAAGLDTPGLDARRLLAFATGLDPTETFRAPERILADDSLFRLSAAVRRRLGHEPVSRIVGEREFHGLALEVGPATLDPRPDTETLVGGVLALVLEGAVPHAPAPHILDLGTGTGAILIALLAALEQATGVGVDRDAAALAVAERNVGRHGLERRATLVRSDWLAGIEGPFDIVVSNPPYIRAADLANLDPEVRDFDPVGALDGGRDGLDAYRAISADIGKVLAPAGWLAVEVGAGQADDVTAILLDSVGSALESVRHWTDLSGIRRCVAIQARS